MCVLLPIREGGLVAVTRACYWVISHRAEAIGVVGIEAVAGYESDYGGEYSLVAGFNGCEDGRWVCVVFGWGVGGVGGFVQWGVVR